MSDEYKIIENIEGTNNLKGFCVRLYDDGIITLVGRKMDPDFHSMNQDQALKLLFALVKILKWSPSSFLSSVIKTHWNWVEEMGWHNKTPLESLALICSEVGEAANTCRQNEPNENFGEELADIILRTLDLAESLKIDIDYEISTKMLKNKINGTKGRLK